MDESTYNNIYRNASPMTPSTPANAFQTNVNRTKTRKWVEAKKVDYGGDDWGNEFEDDEEAEEDVPPGPPKITAGLRSIGQPAQPMSQSSSSNRSVSQPAAAFGHIRGESFGRTPSGPPALHLQTQQPTPAKHFEPVETFPHVDPTAFDEPDHRYPETVVSPVSGNMRPFAPGPGYPGRREYSPAPQDHKSPAPSHASAPSSRFPPRKSSIGQQDAPASANAVGSQSGPHPSSTGRPWREQRSDSPGQQTPTATANIPSKPLPFIRPADIYRRMEEEKEKERRSLDSADRPSIDSQRGPASDRSSSPAGPVRSHADQRRRPSFEKEDNPEAPRSLKQTLAPVAERRSEYGLDRLINESQSTPIEIDAPKPAVGPHEAVSNTSIAAPIPQHSLEQPHNTTADRRKSTSPRLPDLARMSGFGTDFWMGNPGFPDSEEPQATLFGKKSTQHPVKSEGMTGTRQDADPDALTPSPSDSAHQLAEQTSNKHVESTDANTVQSASGLLDGPGIHLEDGPSVRDMQSGTAERPREEPLVSSLQPPSPPTQETATSSVTPSRPSIPGGWISETTNAGSEIPTPLEKPETIVSHLSPVLDNEKSPVTDLVAEDIVPTTAVKSAHPVEPGSSASSTSETVQPDGNEGNNTGEHDKTVAETAGESFRHHAASTTPALLPLQASKSMSAPDSQPNVDEATTTSQVILPSYSDTASKHSTSIHPTTATTSSGVTPTAPLNTKKSTGSASDFVAPDFLPRSVTMSSMDTSSPNESDRLREDIIKSLSPVDSALAVTASKSLGADRPIPTSVPELTRESRYLSGVYDDYLGPSEDKPLREVNQPWKSESSSAAPVPEQSSHNETTIAEKPSFPVTEANSASKSPEQNSFLARRFSWEQEPEQLIDPLAGELPLRPHPTEVTHESTEPPAAISHVTYGREPNPSLQVESDGNSGSISHQVSVASSHPPGGLSIAGIEPPSPVSVVSAERGPGAHNPNENTSRRISLAEEKAAIQSSSSPVSPSPPQGDHPALAKTPPPEIAPKSEDNVNPVATPPKSTIITGWREILSLPSPALRIEKFHEARVQFSAMDSGLTNWLQHMHNNVDHGAWSSSFPATSDLAAGTVASQGPTQSSPTSAQPPAQQPYYQQYLNASNPNLVSAPPGPVRQSTGNLLSSGQQPTSGFGSSKNQVGAKSKELLQAAGAFGNKATKAGMKSGLKLFNKGKDKLRGSGDKVFQ